MDKKRNRRYSSINKDELEKSLRLHKLWLDSDGKDGEKTVLKRCDLRKIDFRGKDLRKIDVRQSNMAFAKLDGANLAGASIGDVNLFKASMEGCNLSGANAPNSDFSGVNANGAKFQAANLRAANFSKSQLEGADFNSATLNQVDFRNSALDRANFRKAKLEHARLNNSFLIGANLSRATLINSNFSSTNITGVTLYENQLDGWVIDNVICEYIYANEERDLRVPSDRSFASDEFINLFKTLPTIEYHFRNGFSPIDPILLSKVIQVINEEEPSIGIEFQELTAKGLFPRARFSVSSKEKADLAIKVFTEKYEALKEQVADRVLNISINNSGGIMSIGKINISGDLVNEGIIGDNGTVINSGDSVKIAADNSSFDYSQKTLISLADAVTKVASEKNVVDSTADTLKNEIHDFPSKGIKALSESSVKWIKDNSASLIANGGKEVAEVITNLLT